MRRMLAASLRVCLSLLAVAPIAFVAQAGGVSLDLSRDYDNVVVETFDWETDFIADQTTVTPGGYVISTSKGAADWTLIETLHGGDLHDPRVSVRVQSGSLHIVGGATEGLSPHLADEGLVDTFETGVVSGILFSLRASFEIVLLLEVQAVTESLIVQPRSARWGPLTWREASVAFSPDATDAWWYARQGLREHLNCHLNPEEVDSTSRLGAGSVECRILYDVGSEMIALSLDGRVTGECHVGRLVGIESLQLAIYTESLPPAEGPVDCSIHEVLIAWDDP